MKISKDKAFSIMESLLFMSPEPRPLYDFENLFEGELSSKEIQQLLKELQESYKQQNRGVYLENIKKSWQLRTKTENKSYLLKIKPKSVFRLSKPSLEVLSIIAFQQPCTKMEIDEMRGVESGHLLRTLMEKELICLAGKSDLPGKASLYKTHNKFLEVFGLNSLEDLPSKKELEELMPEKKHEETALQKVSEEMEQGPVKIPYQEDEQENKKIKDTLKSLPSTVEFLEEEKEEAHFTDTTPSEKLK